MRTGAGRGREEARRAKGKREARPGLPASPAGQRMPEEVPLWAGLPAGCPRKAGHSRPPGEDAEDLRSPLTCSEPPSETRRDPVPNCGPSNCTALALG